MDIIQTIPFNSSPDDIIVIMIIINYNPFQFLTDVIQFNVNIIFHTMVPLVKISLKVIFYFKSINEYLSAFLNNQPLACH